MITRQNSRTTTFVKITAVLAGFTSLAVWLFFHVTPGVIEHGSRERAQVALTFDADMTPRMLEELRTGVVEKWYDERIVSALESESVPATFFFSGLWAETYPEVVRKLSETAIFEIANHSYDHGAFSWPCYGLPRAHDKIAEITKTQEILTKITGRAAVFFRFPGGCFSATDLGLLYFMGLRAVGWDVISSDAFEDDGQKIFDHTSASVRNGSIVVMHLSGPPNAPMTAVVLPSIIKNLRERGFSFVTISRLLLKDEQPRKFTLSRPLIRESVSARSQWTSPSEP